ncbi:hypothetical protein SUGI_0636320 [Cryptomeria japonica]|nr:hypothetical protein SUGI_0636320 [Cryptomeria japonica]
MAWYRQTDTYNVLLKEDFLAIDAGGKVSLYKKTLGEDSFENHSVIVDRLKRYDLMGKEVAAFQFKESFQEGEKGKEQAESARVLLLFLNGDGEEN